MTITEATDIKVTEHNLPPATDALDIASAYYERLDTEKLTDYVRERYHQPDGSPITEIELVEWEIKSDEREWGDHLKFSLPELHDYTVWIRVSKFIR